MAGQLSVWRPEQWRMALVSRFPACIWRSCYLEKAYWLLSLSLSISFLCWNSSAKVPPDSRTSAWFFLLAPPMNWMPLVTWDLWHHLFLVVFSWWWLDCGKAILPYHDQILKERRVKCLPQQRRKAPLPSTVVLLEIQLCGQTGGAHCQPLDWGMKHQNLILEKLSNPWAEVIW